MRLIILRPTNLTFQRSLSRSVSTKKFNLGLINGDGIGSEVIPAAREVLDSLPSKYNLKFDYQNLEAGFETFLKQGKALPDKTVEVLQNCDGGLFGAVSSPSHKVEGYSSPIVALRKKLDLYANVRPVISVSNDSNSKNIDLVIVRENTECLYIKDEEISVNEKGEKVAIARRKISEYASRRSGEMAFKLALQRMNRPQASKNSGKVTVVHKSNVLSITDGLWRETIKEVYEKNSQFHGVKLEEQLVDSMIYRLFREPDFFDVVVAPNLYGDIISDGAAALVGSLGVVPSANVGEHFVLGEPVHGSAPDIAGSNKANPVAAIRSASLLLTYLNQAEAANSIDLAVNRVLKEGRLLTPDLGGSATTKEVTQQIIKYLD